MSKGRVLVAMSGGVDSSVAAALLVEQGYEVIGATMQVWDYSKCSIDEGSGTCCSSIDVDDARSVADKLGIPFYVLNCETQFKSAVIDPFIDSYLQGQTPLPCVNCNTFLKFDHMIKKMKELECDFLATGHYAVIQKNDQGQACIKTSTDDLKDQTYFLFTIDPDIIPKLIFPIGHIKKPEVRAIAEKYGLTVARKKDSTGICFVGNKGYQQFISEHVDPMILQSKRGPIRRIETGEILGYHEGIHLYTYGQSKGIGLTHHEKLFVIKVDAKLKTVWVGDEKYLFSNEVVVYDQKLILPLTDGEAVQVKIRYHHKASEAQIYKQDDGGLKIVFQEPQRAVTPGQAAVIYRNKELVGGGWIRV